MAKTHKPLYGTSWHLNAGGAPSTASLAADAPAPNLDWTTIPVSPVDTGLKAMFQAFGNVPVSDDLMQRIQAQDDAFASRERESAVGKVDRLRAHLKRS